MKAPASTAWIHECNCVLDEEVAPQDRFRDPETGIFPLRLTSEPCVSTHIYPEHPASTPDGRRFVFSRRSALGGPESFWIADVTTRRVRRITDEPEARAPVVMPDGRWLYYSVGQAVWRMSAETFEREECFTLPADIGPAGGIRTVSADGTRFLTNCRPGGTDLRRKPGGPLHGRGPGRYGVAVVDVASGTARVVFEHPDARNPHEQFGRTPSRLVMVQVNDGIEVDADGNLVRLVGADGASLHVVNDDGTAARKLAVGSSPLERVQGHQCWVGGRDLVITSLHRRASPASPWVQDRLVTVAPGDERYRVVGEGHGFTHVHTTPDGRFWVADCNRTADVFVGSLRTGRLRRFCRTGSSFGSAQYTHPHPFFLGDGKTIGWNSDVTGVPQVWCAAVPDGFLEDLER